MKKLLSIALSVALVVMMLAGCGNKAASATSGAKSFKIGFSQCTLASPFYTTMKDAAEAFAKNNNLELVFISADDDVQKQNADVMDMISSGIDALIINPMNNEGVSAALQAAADAGIPIVTIDRFTSDPHVTARIVRDNEYMGQIVGEQLLKELEADGITEGTILEIQGTAGDSVMMARRDGFDKVFAGKNYTIVKSVNCDYTRSLAVTATQDLIQANDNIVAIYGHNDDMSVGALQACTEAGLSGIKVCGVDGLMEAVKAIANNEGYCATSMNDPTSLLQIAMQTCVKLLNGETVDKEVDAGTGLISSENAKKYVSSLAFAENK